MTNFRQLRHGLIATSAICAAALAAPAHAQDAPTVTCENLLPLSQPAAEPQRPISSLDLVRIRQIGRTFRSSGPSALSISPDGKQAAFVIYRGDPATNSYCIGLSVLDLTPGSKPRLLDQGGQIILYQPGNRGRIWNIGLADQIVPQWSPDGRSIAWLRRDKDLTQIWVADARLGSARQVTNSPVDVENFAWRPDGLAIIYASRTGLLAERDALAKEALSGYHYDERYVPAMSNRPMADSAIPLSDYTVELATSRESTASESERALLPRDPINAPPAPLPAVNKEGWSAQALRPATDPRGPRSLVVTTPASEKFSCPAAICEGGVEAVWWLPNHGPLLFLRREGWDKGDQALYSWRPGSGDPRLVLRNADLLSDCTLAGSQLICLRETATAPQRIVAIDPMKGTTQDLYDPNPEFRAIRFGKVQRLAWRNDGGLEVRGDLVLPRDYKPGQRLPLIVTTYTSDGFLRGAMGNEYPIHVFAEHGFAVLSYHWPKPIEWNGDPAKVWEARDSRNSAVLTGVQRVIDMGIADSKRVGISGLSDGSTTSEFAMVNTHAFAAAAVSSCCMEANTVNALAGPTFAKVMREFGFPAGTAKESDAFWRHGSIVQNAASIDTPLLIQQSDHEYLLAIEPYAALKEQGKPVDMYVFQDAYHHKWQPAQQLAVMQRNVQWFDFWLNGREDPAPVDPQQYQRWKELKAKMAKP